MLNYPLLYIAPRDPAPAGHTALRKGRIRTDAVKSLAPFVLHGLCPVRSPPARCASVKGHALPFGGGSCLYRLSLSGRYRLACFAVILHAAPAT